MQPEEKQAFLGLAERAVLALEELAKDPVIQVETSPPICPHCEQMNPVVKVRESEAEGPLAQFIIRATCLQCGNDFLALPYQMDCVKTATEAAELLNERVQSSGFNGREN
jgi:hypothetical protein